MHPRPVHPLLIVAAVAGLAGCLAGAYTMADADLTLTGPTHARYGYAVTGAFDFDRDDTPDIAVGAPIVGHVYVYDGAPMVGTFPLKLWQRFEGEAGGEAGWALARGQLAGWDTDADLVIAAPSESSGRGRVYVLRSGAAIDPNDAVHTTLVGENAGDYAGWDVAVGDFDGNGTDDLAIGACGTTGFDGAVYIVDGPLPYGTVNLANANVTIRATEHQGQFGCSVAGSDLDGDGDDELIVGAPQQSLVAGVAPGAHGKVHIVWELADGDYALSAVAARTQLVGEWPTQNLGFDVAGGGDVNGDGFEEIVIGAPSRYCHLWNDHPDDAGGGGCDEAPEGTAYVVYGEAEGLPDLRGTTNIGIVATNTVHGAAPMDELGAVVTFPGDLNGDGYSEVFVGSKAHKGFLWYGATTAVNPGYADVYTTGAQATFDGSADAQSFAASAAGPLGDLDGDGFDDLLFAAPGQEWYEDGAQNKAGKAYVFFGGE